MAGMMRTLATRPVPFDPAGRRTFVFSHPNHELAVFGLAQRLRPSFIFLTDGGGSNRVAETKRGLERIGMADRALFLDYPEAAFYAALLDADLRFFDDVVARAGAALLTLDPDEVLCDAIELYNPVHDLTLPLVRAALGGRRAHVYEIPLIYQKPHVDEDDEEYEVQRLPPAERDRRMGLRLTPNEVDMKLLARDRIYTELKSQLGGVLDMLPNETLAEEEIAPARAAIPESMAGDRVLRYEWRGKLLQARGLVDQTITWADHYLPVARALFPSAT
jgi:hypothetical protein